MTPDVVAAVALRGATSIALLARGGGALRRVFAAFVLAPRLAPE